MRVRLVLLRHFFLLANKSRVWSETKSGRVDALDFFFLISTKAISEAQCHRPGVISSVHIQMLSVETYCHIGHACIEEVFTLCGYGAFSFCEVPLHAGREVEGRSQVKCALDERCLYIAV